MWSPGPLLTQRPTYRQRLEDDSRGDCVFGIVPTLGTLHTNAVRSALAGPPGATFAQCDPARPSWPYAHWQAPGQLQRATSDSEPESTSRAVAGEFFYWPWTPPRRPGGGGGAFPSRRSGSFGPSLAPVRRTSTGAIFPGSLWQPASAAACYKYYRNSQGSIPSRDGGRIRQRLRGTIVHHARYPHTKARMCSAALMYIRAALAASHWHACAWPRDNEPWAD